MAAKKKAAAPKKAAAKKKTAAKPKAATKKKAVRKKKTAAKKKATAPKKAAAKKGVRGPAPKKAASATKEPVPAAALELEDVDLEDLPEEPVELLPPMPAMPKRRDGAIRLAYGAGADQAFMVFALATQQVETEGRTYELVRGEVQDLEREAAAVVHDVTAISFGAYPRLRDRYLLLSCGGSYGDYQGPVLVARKPIRAGEVEGLEVAVPGEDSAAALALRLWLPHANLKLRPMPVREISLRVRAGHVRAGLLVNEDLVTYRNHNLMRVVDLGHWWGDRTEGLPLALGAHVVRRDIPSEERVKIALDMKRSIAYALGHREEALDWAMQFAGKNTRETLDRYVARTVNDLSLDCGERGRQAALVLYREGARQGFLDQAYEPVFHGDEALEE